jgi:hypothetical protein
MIQCYACQDWFHAACIKEGYKQEIPDDEIESDYVCRDCMKKHPFLQKYDNLLVVVSRTGGEGDVVVKEEPKSETLGESKIADPEKAPQCLIIDKSSQSLLSLGAISTFTNDHSRPQVPRLNQMPSSPEDGADRFVGVRHAKACMVNKT